MNCSDRPVVLSSLLYEDNLHSKLVYAFFFFSSLLSVCTSFSTMLYKGENRLLTNIFSLTFLKLIIMTATKFIIQSYIISIAIKSLMYKFVSKFQYFPPHTEDNELFRALEEQYYRGEIYPGFALIGLALLLLLSHWLRASYVSSIEIFSK